MGVAIRAAGVSGGFWSLDNVRLVEVAPALIPIENASFESPQTSFTNTYIYSWQKTPESPSYVASGFDWSQVTGVFSNLSPLGFEYTQNCDGNQAAWVFAFRGAGVDQNLAATFEVGKCYQLTVGVLGEDISGLRDGSALEIRLYYCDANNAKVIVGATAFTYDHRISQNSTFWDVRLYVPAVQDTDPWAGKKIGVELISAFASTLADDQPGFWDVDNIRLTWTPSQEDPVQESSL